MPGEHSTSLKQIQDRVTTVCANQVRAHDAVLAGAIAAPSPSAMSWLSDVADARSSRHSSSGLESITDAVDIALATYNDEP